MRFPIEAGLRLVLGYGALVRLVGINFPVAYGPDQELLVGLGIGVAHGDLNPHYAVYSGLAIYLPALAAKAISLVRPFPTVDVRQLAQTLQIVNGSEVARTLERFYVGVRLLTASLGIPTIAITYVHGARAYSRRAGLLAAAIVATAAGHAVESHFAAADVPAAFWTAAAALAALRVAERGTATAGAARSTGLFALAAGGAGRLRGRDEAPSRYCASPAAFGRIARRLARTAGGLRWGTLQDRPVAGTLRCRRRRVAHRGRRRSARPLAGRARVDPRSDAIRRAAARV